MLLMLAVAEIGSAPPSRPRALWDRPEKRCLCRWFKLQVVAHTGCQERGTTKRIGFREFWVTPDRSTDGLER